jgi:hypothetical protein
MPFESEEVDLQKLNVIVQFVFLNLNSLSCSASFDIETIFLVLFLAHPTVQKIVEINEKLSKLCALKVK